MFQDYGKGVVLTFPDEPVPGTVVRNRYGHGTYWHAAMGDWLTVTPTGNVSASGVRKWAGVLGTGAVEVLGTSEPFRHVELVPDNHMVMFN